MEKQDTSATNGHSASSTLQNIATEIAHAVEEAKKAIANASSTATEKVEETARQSKDYTESTFSKARTWVSTNPKKAMAIGVGIGLVLASFAKIARRRRAD